MDNRQSDETYEAHSIDFSYLDNSSDHAENNSQTDRFRASFMSIDSPEMLRQIYADARQSTWKDGIKDFLILFFLCIVMIMYSYAITVTHYNTAKETEEAITKCDRISGVMTYISYFHSDFSENTTTILYKYEYNGKKYEGYQEMSNSAAIRLGAVDKDSKGTAVTVYVDPNDPKVSYLKAADYPLMIEWLFPALPTIGIIVAGKVFLECANGERYVYYKDGKKKIRKFK